MQVRAGLDIGNATTEVVLVSGESTVVAADRMPTRGAKGSPESVRAAAALVTRTVRRARAELLEVRTCAIRPVRTVTVQVSCDPPDTGPIQVLQAGSSTVGGGGFAAGRPWDLRGQRPFGPVVAVAPSGMGYRWVVSLVRAALAEAAPVQGVVTAEDDAVLIANRLPGLPVIDQVDAESACRAQVLVVEVAHPGHPPAICTDAFAIGTRLSELVSPRWQPAHLSAAIAHLEGVSNCVLAVQDATGGPAVSSAPRALWPRGWRPLVPEEIAGTRVGEVTRLSIDGHISRVADVTALPLQPLTADLRRGHPTDDVLLATLDSRDNDVDPAAVLSRLLEVPVTVCSDADAEAAAARDGAWTTPGAGGSVVVDLGAGTVDVIRPDGSCATAAGSGELLTRAVANVLGVTRAVAEHAKRGPSVRVDQPQIVEDEDGARRFIDPPLPGDVVGRLAVEGPVGLVALPSSWAPPEWRAVRRRAKAGVFGTSIARCGVVGLDEPTTRWCWRSARRSAAGNPSGGDGWRPVAWPRARWYRGEPRTAAWATGSRSPTGWR
jgi:hypothetical protein